MDRIANLRVTNNIITATFLTKDISEANVLRRAILSEIETYAIDVVIFYVNFSPRHDEIIALRLGQLVIDHERFTPPENGEFRTRIDFTGPGVLTSDNIPGLPFKFTTPIITLKTGHRIMCDVIVKKGQGKEHVKWRPVSTVVITEVDDGYQFTIKEIGMLTAEQIFTKGIEKMSDAAHRAPITRFFHPLVPSNI